MSKKQSSCNKAQNKSYYMYGRHAVLSALRNNIRHIEHIICNQEFFKLYEPLLQSHKLEIVNDKVITQKLKPGYNHQGVIAKVRGIFLSSIKSLELDKHNCKLIILDQITDPQNIGSIIRSAAAFGIDAIILPQYHAPDENATIAKTASGGLELIKIAKITNLSQAIAELKRHGFWIIGFDGNAKSKLDNQLLSEKVAMVFGSEDSGMRKSTAQSCDYLVKIPISSNVQSLNVSNAVSIACYTAANYCK